METINDADIVEYLSEINLFDGLNPSELAHVSLYMHVVSFEVDEIVFSEGDVGDSACFVVSGELEIRKNTDKGSVTIATVGRGRSIGEMSVVDGASRSASAAAVKAGRLVMLYRERFEELLVNHPRCGVYLLMRLARIISLNLRKTSAEYAELLG